MRISYLEIYNETLRDLLEPDTKSQDLKLQDKNGRIIVTNLKEEVVTGPVDVFEALMRGERTRSVAGTDWNLRSSRSHCVFSMVRSNQSGGYVLLRGPCRLLSHANSPRPLARRVASGQLRTCRG